MFSCDIRGTIHRTDAHTHTTHICNTTYQCADSGAEQLTKQCLHQASSKKCTPYVLPIYSTNTPPKIVMSHFGKWTLY